MHVNRYHITLASAAAALFLTGAVPAGADATAQARSAIQANYAKMDAAAAKKNAPAFIAYFDPSFVAIGPKGQKQGLSALKTGIPKMFQAARSIKVKTDVQTVILRGNEATASIKEHSEIVFANPKNPAETKTLVADGVGEHVWVKTAKGWLQKQAKRISSKQTLDGQPIGQP